MNAQNLLDKYIKYDSKITFDIFKLMYQKLIDLGFISPHKVEYAFQEFSGKYNYFVMKVYDDDLYFNQYASAEKQQSEITVKDLLGYNPFESFKLPEKWYIEVGENAKIIDKWKQTTNYKDPASNFKYVTCRGSGYVNKSDYTDHSEITFDQFKQYVLKEPIVTKPPKPFPSRWCIELNKTTIPIVGNYYNKKHLTNPNCVTYTESAEGYYVCSHNDRGEYVKNGYTACSFFTTPSDDCPEITLEDFKQFVMEETTSKPKIESKEGNPEYVKCFFSASSTFILNKIYKCCTGSTSTTLKLDSEKGDRITLPYEGSVWKFKPSTKEAFEMQTKSFEKWSVGSYIVPLQDRLLTRDEPLIKGKPYQITKRSSIPYIMCEKGMEINFCDYNNPETTEGIKWFATLKEAEEFAKTLVKSVECEEGKCTSEITKTRFKKGDYVVSLRPEHLSTLAIKFNHCYIQYKDGDKISISSGTTMYEDDINYARLATPEEIEEYKRIGKPYDVTTLHPSINTYGLNVSDKLDAITIVAWEKQGFNYFSDSSEGWRFGNGAPYFGDRKIENFKVIDGVVGFLVSGTLGSYLRAEGFKEFAENYKLKSTSNFKVGSWYKYNGYYLKYSKTNDQNIFIASEYIDISNNEFKDKLINFTCGTADDSKELVKDLLVIQKYLPEGHPDKIIKNPIFEVGKWYQGKNETCYGKLTAPIEDDYEFPSTEYISSNGVYCSYGHHFAGENWTKFAREVPLSEIQQFLPDGHPDKIEITPKKVIEPETFRVRVTSSEIKVLKI